MPTTTSDTYVVVRGDRKAFGFKFLPISHRNKVSFSSREEGDLQGRTAFPFGDRGFSASSFESGDRVVTS